MDPRYFGEWDGAPSCTGPINSHQELRGVLGPQLSRSSYNPGETKGLRKGVLVFRSINMHRAFLCVGLSHFILTSVTLEGGVTTSTAFTTQQSGGKVIGTKL